MSKCSLFLVDEDLFFNFSSSSYSIVTGIKTKLLKRGAKDATRMARSMQEHGICSIKYALKSVPGLADVRVPHGDGDCVEPENKNGGGT